MNIPEETLVRSDGEARAFHTVTAPILSADGAVAMLVAVSRDITERKREERHLAQTRDAALQALCLQSTCLVNLRHGLHTPFDGTPRIMDLLLDTSLTVKQRELTATMRSRAAVLLTGIDDILLSFGDYWHLDATSTMLDNNGAIRVGVLLIQRKVVSWRTACLRNSWRPSSATRAQPSND